MALTVRQIGKLFAAEITGADLTKPLPPEDVKAIRDAMTRYGVCVIRDAKINDEQQVRFGRTFSSLELPKFMGLRALRIAPELYDVSNLGADGKIEPSDAPRRAFDRANAFFHIDSSFNALPTTWSCLSARVLPPEEGDTEFIDMREVYAATDAATRAEIDNLEAEHGRVHSLRLSGFEPPPSVNESTPPVIHPFIKTAPDGRKMIFAGAHCGRIIGYSEEKSRALLKRIIDFARQPQFRYVHKWKPHDLLMWDNRSVLHRAAGYDSEKHVRDLRQVRLVDLPEDANKAYQPA